MTLARRVPHDVPFREGTFIQLGRREWLFTDYLALLALIIVENLCRLFFCKVGLYILIFSVGHVKYLY